MTNPTEGLPETAWPGVYLSPTGQYVIELSHNQGWLTVPTTLDFGRGGFEGYLRRLRATERVTDSFDVPFELISPPDVHTIYLRSDREYDAGVRHDEPGTGSSSTSEAVGVPEAASGSLIVPGGDWMATVVVDRFVGKLPFEVEFVTVPVTAFVDGVPQVVWARSGVHRLVPADTIEYSQLVLLWHPRRGTSQPHRNRPAAVSSRREAERYCRRWYKTNFPQKKG